ncbi:MAG: hypothetical protein HYX69_02010 [Planctomycetia bacterium]|nr:hypothetical protein [Planctomycetia bacterium]
MSTAELPAPNGRAAARMIALLTTLVVVVHFVVVALHSWAHVQLDIPLGPLGTGFVWVVIIVGPILAAVLAWTRYRRAAAVILTASMAGSLAFGFWNHFVVESNDHVGHIPAGTPGEVFVATAVALVIVELAGVALGGWSIARLRETGGITSR